MRVLANGAVWLGAAALCIVTHRVVSPCQGMICRLGLKIMPTLQPLHTGKMWRTYNWLTDIYHTIILFLKIRLLKWMFAWFVDRGLFHKSIHLIGWNIKEQEGNGIAFSIDLWHGWDAHVSNEVSHTTDFILHRSRVQCGQLVTAATVFWCRQTAHCHNLTSPQPKYHVPCSALYFSAQCRARALYLLKMWNLFV